MDVSVIIVNYNTLDVTKKCIESLFKQTKDISFEVIVIDNASTDGSYDYFKNDNRILYKYLPDNVGFGRANNIGYKLSRGKYIFLLNSDTIILNNALRIFCDKMNEQLSDIAVLGSLLMDLNGNYSHSFGDYLSFSSLFPKNTVRRNISVPEEGLIVPVVIGADMFIKREVIELLGFFDPIFFMYHEENDLQRRFGEKGFKSKIINGPKIIHLEGASCKNRINIRKIEGTFTYIKKWYSYPSYLLFRIIYAITRSYKLLKCNTWIEFRNCLKVLLFY